MKTKLFGLLLAAVLLYSCKDFVETDLDKKSVTVLAPADNVTSSSFKQQFWWEEVKGADKYNLQIVKPNFVSVQKLIVDTMVKGTMFNYTLQPGTYQWRIRAVNSSSHTEYVTYNLTIDSTLDLGKQPISLITPADNYYTNKIKTASTFTWQTMPNADSYLFQVLSSNIPINTQTPTLTTATYMFVAEGVYTWRVQAQNVNSSSLFSTRTITVDTTRPSATTPLSPLADSITANPVILSWNSVSDAYSYRIQVSTDPTFVAVTKDTTTIATTYNLYNAAVGVYYYWRVKSIDKATNESAYFASQKIKRN